MGSGASASAAPSQQVDGRVAGVAWVEWLEYEATYCEWGLDYLKNDNCGGTNWPAENTSWIKFQQGFDKCYAETGRYVIKSIEYCREPKGQGGCGDWIADVANLWRTTGDVQVTPTRHQPQAGASPLARHPTELVSRC